MLTQFQEKKRVKMKQIIKSDPITGTKFHALEFDNGNIKIPTPFQGVLNLEYNKDNNTYTFNKDDLKYYEVCSIAQAAEILNVSRIRVWRMCRNGTLKNCKIADSIIISLKSVKEYKSSEHAN